MHAHKLRSPLRRSARGFTLVEVLVALFIMAILAGMAWKGLDGLMRVRDGAQGSAERTLQQATAIAQWEQDLQQLQVTPGAPPFRCDSSALRLTRRSPDGLQLVVWTLQDSVLYRWASPPLTRLADLQDWWIRSQQWSTLRESALPMLGQISNWQTFPYRQGDASWSNCQSTGNRTTKTVAKSSTGTGTTTEDETGSDTTTTTTTTDTTTTDDEELPLAVRLQITLPDGTLMRDILLRGSGA